MFKAVQNYTYIKTMAMQKKRKTGWGKKAPNSE